MDLGKLHGRAADAITHYQAALRLQPDHEAAVRLHPSYQNEHNLGAMLTTIPGRQSEAIVHLEAAQRIRSDPETGKLIDRLRAGVK